MDFQRRLEKAIERGQRVRGARRQAEAEKALTEKDLARLHSQYRLELSERIEDCLKQLMDRLPGFRFETVVGERGWGAAVNRDDIELQPGGGRTNFFSRLEIVVRPASSYHLLDLTAKGTVRNREVSNRSHFQPLDEVDLHSFTEMIDLWVLEFAELYAAKT